MDITHLATLFGAKIDIHELGELLRHGAPGFALATTLVSFFLVLAWFSRRTDSPSKSPWPLYVFMVFSIVCFGLTLVLPPDPLIVVRSELQTVRRLIQEERLMQCSIIANFNYLCGQAGAVCTSPRNNAFYVGQADAKVTGLVNLIQASVQRIEQAAGVSAVDPPAFVCPK